MRTSIGLMTVGLLIASVACGDSEGTGASGASGGSGGSGASGGNGGDPQGGAPVIGGSTSEGGTPAQGGNGGEPGTGGDPSVGGNGGDGNGGEGTGGESSGPPTAAQCAEECEEAQTGECTAITGNCTTCCTAALSITACEDEQTAYYECVSAGNSACDADCSTQEDAIFNCVLTECQQNPVAACQTLFGCAQ